MSLASEDTTTCRWIATTWLWLMEYLRRRSLNAARGLQRCAETYTYRDEDSTYMAQRSFNSTHTSALGKFLHFQLTTGQDVPRSFRFHVSAIFRRHDLSGTKDARFFGASLKQYDLAGRLVTNSRVGARHGAENQI